MKYILSGNYDLIYFWLEPAKNQALNLIKKLFMLLTFLLAIWYSVGVKRCKKLVVNITVDYPRGGRSAPAGAPHCGA